MRSRQPTQQKPSRLYHSAAYYPELWPVEDIARDIEYMREAGINLVRIGEFAWSAMEPCPDSYTFDFFISVMDQFHAAGIETIFCTPTATPPVWLTHGHPERCFVDRKGVVMGHGARQHICTDHPYVRERVRKLVEELAKAIGRHPGLIAWQIDNEFRCHVSENFSVSASMRWEQWLKQKFGTIEALNNAWGTAIWSEAYESFGEVPQPMATPCMHNASLDTAYRRFNREMIAEYQMEQVAIIREHSSAPITHNGNLWFHVDPDLMYQDLDFAAFDHYMIDDAYEEILMHLELWRTLTPSRGFWLLETGSSHNGSIHAYHRPHRRNFVRAEAVAAYASGAGNFGYWVWRQQRTGVELPHGCVISAWQEPAIGYENVLAVNAARKEIEPHILDSSLIPAEMAVTFSDTARIFLQTEPLENLEYNELMRLWSRRLRDAGYYFDLTGEQAELGSYKILFTPFQLSVSDVYREKVLSWVQSGGTWILGPLSCGRTEHHTVPTNAAMGIMESIAGVKTKYTYPMSDSGAVGHAFDYAAPLGLWSHVFEPVTALSRGIITGGQTPGLSFITEQVVGKGKIVLLGSLPTGDQGDRMILALARHYATDAGLKRRYEVSPGTVVFARRSALKVLWVIVNLDGKGGALMLPAAARDALSGESIGPGTLSVGVYEHRVLEFMSDPHI